MGALSFFGHFLLGLGPGVVVFCYFIAPKSFVVLLTLFSSCYWLVVMLLTAAIFRGFVPVAPSIGPYAGVLITSVAIEECARYGVWLLHRRVLSMLAAIAARSGHPCTTRDDLSLALGWGYGHAAVHVVFLYASLLPLTAGPGTYYRQECPQLSLFTAAALGALGMGGVLLAGMLVALDGWQRRDVRHIAAPALVHLLAALVSLANLRPHGCLYAIPTLLALGLGSCLYASRMAWRRMALPAPRPPPP